MVSIVLILILVSMRYSTLSLNTNEIGIATNKVGYTTSGYVGINGITWTSLLLNSGNGDYISKQIWKMLLKMG